jgi:IclR family acetate operon transcriptional repressor
MTIAASCPVAAASFVQCVAVAVTPRAAIAVAGPTSRLPKSRLRTIGQQIREELDKVRPVNQGWL